MSPTLSQQHDYRLEIQGLRAVAVIAVIANHLTQWPRGGYLGVDVFFVISGFLITRLLLAEHDRTGTISFVGFYQRRIRRIIPAAILTLLVTVVFSFVVFNLARARSVLVDAMWATFFSANWHFALVGTDYFAASGPISPVQHFWSLGVEEQFYLVWPLLIVITFVLTGRHRTRGLVAGHRTVFVLMLLIVAASYVWASGQGVSNPTWAYFSTFSRAWELGVGALIAVATPVLSRIPQQARSTMAWVGLLGMVASLIALDESMSSPVPLGSLSVVGTALVLAAGGNSTAPQLWPLTNSVAVWIGELSYSLYLWHFPVIILFSSMVPAGTIAFDTFATALIFALAAAAYYGVENPVRRSNWLKDPPPVKLQSRAERQSARKERVGGAGKAALLSLLVAVTIASTGLTILPREQSQSANSSLRQLTPSRSTATQTPEKGGTVSAAQADRTRQLRAALSSGTWPVLKPDINHLNDSYGDQIPCALSTTATRTFTPAEVRSGCLQGPANAKSTALVIGDSLAGAYTPAVFAALAPIGWNVVSLTRSACPAIQVPTVLGTGAPYPLCMEQQQWLTKQITSLKPDLIVLTSAPAEIRHLASRTSGSPALREWQSALSSSLIDFAKTAPVAVLSAPPQGANLEACATRFSHPQDCIASVTPAYRKFNETELKTVEQVGDPTVQFVPTEDWFCVDSYCPAFVGNTPMFIDGYHMTAAQSRSTAPLVREALKDLIK